MSELLECIPQMWRQRCRCSKNELQTTEEIFSQARIVAQFADQQVVTAWHIEINRRCDITKIAHRVRKQLRHRATRIDVKRAAVTQD